MTIYRVLAFAAANGRVGSVVLDDDRLVDWRISDKASDSVAAAQAHARQLCDAFAPDVVVTEEAALTRSKGKHSCALIEAIGEAAEDAGCLAVRLAREQGFINKYAEAEALVELYPELAPWQPPQRCFYEREPRNTVLFEALALALQLRAGG